MEKFKNFLIKLKNKFIKFCKWVWRECKDWHTVVIFIIVVVIMYSPVWGGYLCHALFGWKWCSVMATAYLAFWAGPFTPFFPLCIAITLAVRRIIDKIKGKDIVTMKEYICKIASLDEIETKWNYEISNHKNDEKWITWKNEAIEHFNNGQSVTYYGFLNGKIISEATAVFDNSMVQNSKGLVDKNTAYLCAFRTVKKHQDKGYFSKLFRFMIDDLKDRGYTKVTLGVEPSDDKNLAIYQKYGFDEYIKSAQEKYSDDTVIDVDYYCKNL